MERMETTKKQARAERGLITAAVLKAITAAHPNPLTTSEAARLTRHTMNQASAAINKAGKAGYCHTYQSCKGGTLFAFIDEAACKAYGLQQLQADEQKIVRERNIKHNARANRAIPERPGVPANVVIAKPSRQAWAVREADASGAKIIVCETPKFTARYQLQPDSEAHTGFMADWNRKRSAA